MKLGWYARLTFVVYVLTSVIGGTWWYVTQDQQQRENASVWLRMCLQFDNPDIAKCNADFERSWGLVGTWEVFWQSIGGAALFGLFVPILMTAAYWTVRWILAGRK